MLRYIYCQSLHTCQCLSRVQVHFNIQQLRFGLLFLFLIYFDFICFTSNIACWCQLTKIAAWLAQKIIFVGCIRWLCHRYNKYIQMFRSKLKHLFWYVTKKIRHLASCEATLEELPTVSNSSVADESKARGFFITLFSFLLNFLLFTIIVCDNNNNT